MYTISNTLFRSVFPLSMPFQWTDSAGNIVPEAEVAWASPGSPIANITKLCVFIDYMTGRLVAELGF